MHYYDGKDSVNGKVEKYEFSVEMLGDELMGVAKNILSRYMKAFEELAK